MLKTKRIEPRSLPHYRSGVGLTGARTRRQ